MKTARAVLVQRLGGVGLASVLATSACHGRPAVERPQVPQIEHHGNLVIVPDGSPLKDRLKVEPLHTETLRRQLVAPATVESDPSHLAKISPPLLGRVVKLLVKFGDTVTQGQTLVLIDSPDLAQAQSDFLKAKSAQVQAERTLSRQKDLAQHGIAAEKDVEQAKADDDAAVSELERSRLRLKVLGIDPGDIGKPLAVRSPISGRVIDLNVAPGEFHNDPNFVMMTIADLSTVWLTANVQEKDIRRVHVGDDATAIFAAYPDDPRRGKVFAVNDLLDPETRSVKVRVAFDNPNGELKPGMFATMHFAGASVTEVVAPSTALILVGDKSYVFAEVDGGQFERKPVETGEQIGTLTVITEGAEAGLRIATQDTVVLQ
jgi:cobalt-zinc-cadmium efflux system membrane fusion protein